MAVYTLESNKSFLRSTGGGEVEVYEIENLDIALLEEKNWSGPSTIHFGKRKEYEMLKVGDIEIKGRDLSTFLEDLCDSRLMVNREGLCILPTSKIASDEFEVEYYRMFDLFDWSKYRVKSQLSTMWSRSDVLTGHNLLAAQSQSQSSDQELKMLEQKLKNCEKELENQKLNRESEAKELEDQKRKNESQQKELEDQKRKHESELEAQKRNHQKELAELTGSIKQNDNKFSLKERRITELEEELKLRVYGPSGLQPLAFTKSVAMRARTPYCSVCVIRRHDMWSWAGISPNEIRQGTILDANLSKEAITSVAFRIETAVNVEFDTNNWWATKICLIQKNNSHPVPPISGTFVYYDGNFGYYSFDNSTERMPIPLRNGPTSNIPNYLFCNVQGLGLRYGGFFSD